MFSSRIFKPQTALQWFIRALRSEESDGSETSLKKEVRFQSSSSVTLSNVGEPSYSRIPKNQIEVQKERGNFVVASVVYFLCKM